MSDETQTQQHLDHVITADKRWYKVMTPAGEILHEVNDSRSSAILTNLQRGMMWLENHLGIADEEIDGEEDVISVDIDQSVAIVG